MHKTTAHEQSNSTQKLDTASMIRVLQDTNTNSVHRGHT